MSSKGPGAAAAGGVARVGSGGAKDSLHSRVIPVAEISSRLESNVHTNMQRGNKLHIYAIA